MTVASDETERGGADRAPIGLMAFLSLSALVAVLAGAAGQGLAGLLGKPVSREVLIVATVAGFAVSTAGWLLVLRGFRVDPARMMAHFAAGLLTKLVLLGLVVILVSTLEIASLDLFFIPFATVFFLTGFAQLGITVKGATKLLNEAGGKVSRGNPSAPGAAVDPGERGSAGQPE